MMKKINSGLELAPAITKAASKQTYYTIRWLADRDRITNAYRTYAYFRWVDDILDAEPDSALNGGVSRDLSKPADETLDRSAFIRRQESILESCYRGEAPRVVNIQEQMLVELIRSDAEENSGLQYYLRNMMAVMSFDAGRRGRLISQAELNEYTRWLAGAVTEALHYFIGHGDYSPQNEARYLAVSAAHITHMLRDTYDDVQAGYFNIPSEVLSLNGITPQAVESQAYRNWVRSRVQLARLYFKSGKEYFRQVGNLRCRLAGFAYIARFEWLLDTIEQEDYLLRPHYDERKSIRTGLRMSLDTLSAIAASREVDTAPRAVSVRSRSLR